MIEDFLSVLTYFIIRSIIYNNRFWPFNNDEARLPSSSITDEKRTGLNWSEVLNERPLVVIIEDVMKRRIYIEANILQKKEE